MASGTIDTNSKTYSATVNSKLNGTFTYSKVGHICIGCGTLTANTNITAYESIVSNLPETIDGQSYMGAFVTDSTGYNNFYVAGKTIVARAGISSGTMHRLMCVYMCK